MFDKHGKVQIWSTAPANFLIENDTMRQSTNTTAVGA